MADSKNLKMAKYIIYHKYLSIWFWLDADETGIRTVFELFSRCFGTILTN